MVLSGLARTLIGHPTAVKTARAKKWPGRHEDGRAIRRVRVDLGRAALLAGAGVGAAPANAVTVPCTIVGRCDVDHIR
jgi:hypothetical protein